MSLGRHRAIDRALVGSARAADVVGLVAALRDDARLRVAYDRGVLAMRTLEGADVAEVELDWVERRLEADGTLGGAAEPSRTRWWWIGSAALAAALAVVALRPPVPPVIDDDPLQARGHDDPRAGWFALSVLCDDGRGPPAALGEVGGGTCPHGGTLAFSVRIDGRYRGATNLVIFGIDGDDTVQYYLPTPDQAAGAMTQRDQWIPLDRAVRLSVHHRPGPVRVYAALLPRPATIEAVDAAAAALVAAGARAGDERPWLERLGPTHPLLVDCAPPGCLGAELDLRIEADTP